MKGLTISWRSVRVAVDSSTPVQVVPAAEVGPGAAVVPADAVVHPVGEHGDLAWRIKGDSTPRVAALNDTSGIRVRGIHQVAILVETAIISSPVIAANKKDKLIIYIYDYLDKLGIFTWLNKSCYYLRRAHFGNRFNSCICDRTE